MIFEETTNLNSKKSTGLNNIQVFCWNLSMQKMRGYMIYQELL